MFSLAPFVLAAGLVLGEPRRIEVGGTAYLHIVVSDTTTWIVTIDGTGVSRSWYAPNYCTRAQQQPILRCKLFLWTATDRTSEHPWYRIKAWDGTAYGPEVLESRVSCVGVGLSCIYGNCPCFIFRNEGSASHGYGCERDNEGTTLAEAGVYPPCVFGADGTPDMLEAVPMQTSEVCNETTGPECDGDCGTGLECVSVVPWGGIGCACRQVQE